MKKRLSLDMVTHTYNLSTQRIKQEVTNEAHLGNLARLSLKILKKGWGQRDQCKGSVFNSQD